MKKITIVMLFVMVFTMAFAVVPVSASVPASGGGDCYCDGPGVRSPGYWKNHPEKWPVEKIKIGDTWFTKEKAIEWMSKPVKKDKSITLFKALVATKLNLKAGNCGKCIYYWVGQGDWWFTLYDVGDGVRANSEAWQYSHGEKIYRYLDAYNNGKLCAPSQD